ncbi:O-antigen ligase family protein [Sphaerospermopsis aphanizomenoides BCCUSP55]|uniref:O-antigen ligase family protein n=1 Tax=Sphaerospermopsis aphanizomenoides TaxID=459663 RepID=UPI001907F2DF|nr:O-antigen ligase family protein [Sphaerospermopsis aphanizomenoides]MBK1989814.1 O-antigen ligase family protein [Sphaerospermopsis aphanizomenoides BCCUSP55]
MLGVSLNKAFYHPEPSLQTPWNSLQFGLFVFPINPFLGAVTISLAALITWAKKYRLISRRPLHQGFAFLSLLLLITTGFASHKLEAFLGLFNLLPYFFVFAGLTALIQTAAQLRQIAWIMVCGSIPVVIIGFGQLFLGWTFKLQFLWVLIDWIVAPGGEPPGRMASVLMHANTLAAYLVTIFILGLGLWLENYQKLKQQFKQQFKQQIKADYRPIIFLTIAVIANFIALILTNSRNGWVIAIITCLAYALYQGWRLIVAGFVSIATSILLAAFAPGAIAQFFRRFVPYFIWARLNDDMYPDRPVALMRKTQWEFAWNLTQQHPLTGWGLRSFSGLYKTKMQIDLGHPHNLFLMLSAETGLITTLLFCGLLAWIIITASKLLWKSESLKPENRLIFFSYLLAFIGWILFNTVDVTTFDLRLSTLFWVFLAALCGVIYRYNQAMIKA